MRVMEPPESCKVYTPLPLAEAMVDAIGVNPLHKWLEPSFGHGVFFSALNSRGVKPIQITGVDLERRKKAADKLATVIRGEDFLDWGNDYAESFDCVVGNPPFVSIRSLPSRLRKSAARVADSAGTQIGLSANTWYAFVLRSIDVLRFGGSLAFILPSSCEYADFCKAGRNATVARFDRVDLIRCRRPLFDGVQEGTVVIVCRGKGGHHNVFRRHEVNNLEEVIERLRTLATFAARKCPNGKSLPKQSEVEASAIFQIGLGGVTGDAKYFAITEARRRELGIPLRAVRPVVTKARHVRSAEIDSRVFRHLRDSGERIWLFDPPDSLLAHDAVRNYLDLPIADGGCDRDRYKIRIRDPWYRTPLPKRPDAFVTGMSSAGIWLSFNSLQRLNATNTLYVVRFHTREDRLRKYAWALALLSSPVRRQLRRSCRVYADGLTKFEPGQLQRLHIPIPPRIAHARRHYRAAIDMLMRGNDSDATALADSWVL